MVMYAPGMLKNRDYNFPDKGLRYHFLGGDEVGNVGCLLDDDKKNRLLLDYGIAQQIHQNIPYLHLQSNTVSLHILILIILEWHLGCVQIQGLNFMAHQLQQIYQN